AGFLCLPTRVVPALTAASSFCDIEQLKILERSLSGMKAQLFVAIFSLLLVSVGSSAAAGDFEGNWKLDPAKSKLRTQYTSYVMKTERTGPEAYHIVYDMVTTAGQQRHAELSVTFDGKERPSQNAPAGAVEISEHPNASTWKTTVRRDGKVVTELTAVVA